MWGSQEGKEGVQLGRGAKGVCAETENWLHAGDCQVNILRIMGANFLTVEKRVPNTEREKTRINVVVMNWNQSYQL